MILLKVAIGDSPVFLLAIFLLIAGFGSLVYKTYADVKSKNKRFTGRQEQNSKRRTSVPLLIVALVAILIVLIFFINWIGKIKYDF